MRVVDKTTRQPTTVDVVDGVLQVSGGGSGGSSVTVNNTTAAPVPVAVQGTVTVGTHAVTISGTPAVTVSGTPTVTVGNTTASPVPVSIQGTQTVTFSAGTNLTVSKPQGFPPQVTTVPAATATTGAVLDMTASNYRTHVILQVFCTSGTLAVGTAMSIQCSMDNVTWFDAPTPTGSQAILASITTTTAVPALAIRAELFCRYVRASIVPTAGSAAATMVVWYARE